VRFTSNAITIADGAFDEIASPATAYITPDFRRENIKSYFTNIIILYTPIISSINPNNGCTTELTKVNIIGTSLTNIVSVLFGYKKAPSVVVVSDSLVEVIVPTRIDSGTVDVTLIDVYNKEFIIPGGYTYTVLPLNKPKEFGNIDWVNIDWVKIDWVRGKEKVTDYVNRIRNGNLLTDIG
jgi:hypothetical protein